MNIYYMMSLILMDQITHVKNGTENRYNALLNI